MLDDFLETEKYLLDIVDNDLNNNQFTIIDEFILLHVKASISYLKRIIDNSSNSK